MLAVDTLTFDFPAGWNATKYDDWAFYKQQFSVVMPGIKAVDVIAIEGTATAWLIEVKDYRRNRRTKPSDLSEEVAKKVFDTLAALHPARLNANDDVEKEAARSVCGVGCLRIVLHLEQPVRHSKLFPRAIKPADIQQKLRKLVKPIDAHPLVVDSSAMRNLQWTVS